MIPFKHTHAHTEIEQTTVAVQKDDNKWQQFVEGEVIIKQGFVNKRKGLFARKRMLLLTTGPRLFYIDPVQMVKKGEIPMSRDLRSEPKNFKIFFVHTVSCEIQTRFYPFHPLYSTGIPKNDSDILQLNRILIYLFLSLK